MRLDKILRDQEIYQVKANCHTKENKRLRNKTIREIPQNTYRVTEEDPKK